VVPSMCLVIVQLTPSVPLVAVTSHNSCSTCTRNCPGVAVRSGKPADVEAATVTLMALLVMPPDWLMLVVAPLLPRSAGMVVR
jgi:hypothetical protein